MNYSLSVVIPNYNNSRFLPKCLDSILEQTYEGLLEIIVVDDCSTDSSRKLIQEYADNYPIIKPLFLEKNGRVSAARNAGLYAAQGEYITFVDADDFYYNPDKLKNEMDLIKKYHIQGKDVITYSSIVSVSNDGGTIRLPTIKEKHYLSGNIYDRLLIEVSSSLIMRDYCVKTSLLKSVGGYNTDNSLFEDYELILKLAKKTEFYYTGSYGTAYRDSISGLSKQTPTLLSEKKNEIARKQIATEKLVKRIILTTARGTVSFLKKVYHKLKK